MLRTQTFCHVFACTLILLASAGGQAAPIEVVLEVDPAPLVILTAFGELGGSALEEQYPGSLQATISGHVRVRFDPDDPQTIEFLSAGSHLDLSSGVSPAQPDTQPANLAGQSQAGMHVAAIRNAALDLSSGAIPMELQGGDTRRFESDGVIASFASGAFDWRSLAVIGGSANLAGVDLGANLVGADGSFTWFPTTPGDNLFVQLPAIYRYRPFGASSPDEIFLVVNPIRTFARFSLANVATVGAEGGTVELLGGASVPGGVSATFADVVSPGIATAQQIGLAGLPHGALEQAMTVPDLAYSLVLSGYTNPCFIFESTGEATIVETTINYAGYTNPGFNENRLVVYHYNDAGVWEKALGQVLETQTNTVKFTNPNWSPFWLAVSVPEPASVVNIGLCAAGMAWLVPCSKPKRRAGCAL